MKLLTSHYATFSFCNFFPIFTIVHHMCLEKKVFWRQLHLVETYGKIEISALEYCGVPYWVEKIGEWCRFCRLKLQNIGLRGLFSLQFENWMLTNLFLYRVFHTTMSLEYCLEISQFVYHSDFTWNQFLRFQKHKICHFNTFRGSEFWFLWICALFVGWNLPNEQSSQPLKWQK